MTIICANLLLNGRYVVNIYCFFQLPTSAPDNPLQKTVSTLRDNESAGAMATTGPTLSESSRQAMRGTRWEVMDNEIDENLGLSNIA